MPTRPTSQTVTAAELAELINRITNDPARTGERLKRWTRERLIEPVGTRHPGTGRHHRYDFNAVTVAAVFTLLTDNRISIAGKEGSLSKALIEVQKARQRWQPGTEVYFVVPIDFVIPAGARKGGGLLRNLAFVHEGPEDEVSAKLKKLPFPHIGCVTLNLNAIFAELARGEASHGC